jgi:hypothetical protein
MNIVMFKLVTGEVVMGSVQDESDEVIIIKKPVTLTLDPIQQGVGMIPYDAIYTQEEPTEFTFEKQFIVHFMKVHPQFEEGYIKHTTNIEIAA